MTNQRVRVAALVVALGILSAGACRRTMSPTLTGEAARASFDSLLAAAMPRPLAASGAALLDVEQYRFRGHVRMDVTAAGDASVELGGSSLFGGHREDVAVSLADDTLRVLDRERGRYYEGESLDELLAGGTGARADWTLVVARVLALPGCGREIESLVVDESGARAAGRDGQVRLDIDDGRLERAVWPNPVAAATYDDRLEIRYQWDGGHLQEVTATLPERGWRVRLSFDK